MHFTNNILKYLGFCQSIHLILLKDCVQQRWEHCVQTNKNFPSKGEQTLKNIDLSMKVVKGFHKNGIIRVVKHAFVWHIVYEQRVASMSVGLSRKEDINVLVENWLVKLI